MGEMDADRPSRTAADARGRRFESRRSTMRAMFTATIALALAASLATMLSLSPAAAAAAGGSTGGGHGGAGPSGAGGGGGPGSPPSLYFGGQDSALEMLVEPPRHNPPVAKVAVPPYGCGKRTAPSCDSTRL
jgi:hypothetical protein